MRQKRYPDDFPGLVRSLELVAQSPLESDQLATVCVPKDKVISIAKQAVDNPQNDAQWSLRRYIESRWMGVTRKHLNIRYKGKD